MTDDRKKIEEKLLALLDNPVPLPENVKTAWLDGVSANKLSLREYEEACKKRHAEIQRLKKALK